MNRPARFRTMVLATGRGRVMLYLFLLALYVLGFTVIFHTVYPLWEGEGITWTQAVLFVVETITTVGYGDLLPFASQYTLLLTVTMIATGVFVIFMFVPLLLAPFISEQIRASPPRRLPVTLEDHVVVIGSGKMTRHLLDALTVGTFPVLIVEENEEEAKSLIRRFGRDIWVLWGDYTDAATWKNASIAGAATVVVCEKGGAAASVILGIRGQTRAEIVAVVDNLAYDRYLRYAGAEYVISPKQSAGRMLGRHAAPVRPGEIVLGTARKMEETPAGLSTLRLVSLPVMPGSPAVGRTLADLALPERYGVSVLFFWRGGRFDRVPQADDQVDASTMLFLLGREEQVDRAITEVFTPREGRREVAVIAGFGDVGRAAYREISAAGVRCTVIDRDDPDAGITGLAEDEETLRRAGIEEATTCVVALGDDTINIFTTLLIRNLNPEIRILARANDPSIVDRLYLAGADYVSLLPAIGGQTIAGIVLSGTVRVLLDLPDGGMVVLWRAMHRQKTPVARVERRCGVKVVGIEGEGRAVVAPSGGTEIRRGDAVIVVGDPATLGKCISIL